MTKRFQNLIHVVQLYNGKIKINHVFSINIENCNKKQLEHILDYIYNNNFKILNLDFKKYYYFDIKISNIKILNIDLEKNHVDNQKWKKDNSFIPISDNAFKSLFKLKEKANTWNRNDSLYWSEG